MPKVFTIPLSFDEQYPGQTSVELNAYDHMEEGERDLLQVSDIASANYDGVRDSERLTSPLLQDSDNRLGSSGYYLHADSGTLIASRAIIRGESSVGASTIRGDARITMGVSGDYELAMTAGTANTNLSNGFQIGYIRNVPSLTIDRLNLTWQGSTGTDITNVGQTYIWLVPTTSTNIARSFNSARQADLGTPTNFSIETTRRSVNLFNSNIYNESNGVTISGLNISESYLVYMSVASITSSESGSLYFNNVSLQRANQTAGSGLSSRPPVSTAAYLVADENDEYAAWVQGGLGLRAPSQLLWAGNSATANLVTINSEDSGTDVDTSIAYAQPDCQLIVEVGGTSGRWGTATINVTPSTAREIQREVHSSAAQADINIGAGIIYDGTGDPLCRVSYTMRGTNGTIGGSTATDTVKSVSINNIENSATIRRVWRKFS